MATNVISRNDAALEQNNAVSGSNRLRYEMYVNHLVGGEINKGTGTLEESVHKELSFNVLQKFPDDVLADVIKASATEFPQVQAIGAEFKYCKTALVVEFVLSQLQNIKNTANIEAGILNELYKQYDAQTYTGGLGNYGFRDNPNANKLKTDLPMKTAGEITSAVSALIQSMRGIGVRKSNYDQIAVGFTSAIAEVWDTIDPTSAAGLTVGTIVQAAFPDVSFDEIPEILSVDEKGDQIEYMEASYRPMVNVWHGARPAIYDTEERRYGLEKGTLFAFESAGIQIEEHGAYAWVSAKA